MRNDRFVMSARQSAELDYAFERNNWVPADVKRLSEGSILAGVLAVLNGTAKIKPLTEDAARFITLSSTTIAVNLAATPKLPFDGAEVEQHIGEGWAILEKKSEGLYINGHRVILHLSRRQKSGKVIGGHELREELTGKPVLNANILDALYDNPHLIPEDWKADEDGNIRFIYFWGTIYRFSDGHLYVRYLYFHDGVWRQHCYWLGLGWDGRRSAAVSAS